MLLAYALGAGTVILAYRTFNNTKGTVSLEEYSEPLEAKIDAEELKWREQWQSMMDYDPYKPAENTEKGSEIE